jgi:hypothetical protein
VELEVKLGRIRDGKFVSGLPEAAFGCLLNRLLSTYSWIARPEETFVDCFVSDSTSQLRVSFSAGRGPQTIHKRRISNADHLLNSSGDGDGDAAVRVSLSMEMPASLPPGCEAARCKDELASLLRPPWKLDMVRKKKRQTFFHRSTRGVFKIDMTRTETEGIQGLGEEEELQYEVELEFLNWAVANGVAEAERMKWAVGLVEFIRSAFLKAAQVNESMFLPFEALYTTQLRPNDGRYDLLKKVFLNSFPRRAKTQFPGVLPAPLTRASLRSFDPDQFKVSERQTGRAISCSLYILVKLLRTCVASS